MTDPENAGIDPAPTPIEVSPDDDRDREQWQPLPVDTGATRTATTDTPAAPAGGFSSAGRIGWAAIEDARHSLEAAAADRADRAAGVDSTNPVQAGSDAATAWRRDRLPQADGGTLHVIVAAARTTGVGVIAAHEGADAGTGLDVGAGSALADGMAVRVVTRLDKHEVAISDPDAEGRATILALRYIPAAALTNPRVNLGVVLPDDWNAMVGGTVGHSASGLEHEVNALEACGVKVRHRLYIAATPSSMGVHFGTLAERVDLRAAARDVLRAGGTVQIEAGAMTILDACAAVGLAPWAGWVRRFDMTIVVPCGDNAWDLPDGSARHADVARLARDAVDRNGGLGIECGKWATDGLGLALVGAHKLVPGAAGWDTDSWQSISEADEPPAGALYKLIGAVQTACDGEVDVELVTTGADSIIDLR